VPATVRRLGGASTLLLALLAPVAVPTLARAAACEEWIATAVSVQGSVQARRASEPQWVRVRLNDTYCVGDTIRVDARSRAALALRSGAVLRLDENTTLTFAPPTTRERSWIDLLRGAVYFVSRVAQSLNVRTPYVNAAVEGTELWIEVGSLEAVIGVVEGRVVASNPQGSLALLGGQAAAARPGLAPASRTLVVTPPDAVQWALYYPPLVDARPEDFPDRTGETWPGMARRAIERADAGDLEGAFAALAPEPPGVADPRFFAYRASLLLAVGRVAEAVSDLGRAEALDPRNGEATALRAIVAVTRNDLGSARELAERAARDTGSATAQIALSYVRQATFDLAGALASLEAAVAARPASALARARRAELWLALGERGKALREAREAARLAPGTDRAQTVLGFAALAQIEVDEATAAFRRAIELDSADPLPRLGLGLAAIRGGALDAGIRELEIAVSLDPARSLPRSYLGKAYHEAKRDRLAAEQFALAQALDPRDPTPWFYDAIREQSVNRPVEALRDLQRSIELNDNRAVYRSRLLLDEDRAARAASVARVYDDLGFPQRALLEGWRSLGGDPTSHSAHRFLADSYSVLPRHDVARVSELLQAQLLQPLSITPVQPQLALGKSFILAGTGPASPDLNEFNPLFERNRFSVWASGLVGGNSTYGDEVVLTGLWNRLAVSVGQFHYETDGFRPNNDLEQDVYSVFAQFALSPDTSVQVEYRAQRRSGGDLPLRFDPANFNPAFRQDLDVDTVRVGIRHVLTPTSSLLGSLVYERGESRTSLEGFSSKVTQDGYVAEIQYLLRSDRGSLVAGTGYFAATGTDRTTFGPDLSERLDIDTTHVNGYVYGHAALPLRLLLTLGLSADAISSDLADTTQVSPKFGLTWQPLPDTTIRAAYFRTLQRPLLSTGTIEPTQIAGFNQLFDDAGLGTDTWRYGIGVDHRLTRHLYGGLEFTRRELSVPFEGIDLATGAIGVRKADWREDLVRGYLYWTPLSRVVLSAEYLYERLERDSSFPGDIQVVESRTHRVPLGVAYFDPSGLTGRFRATYVSQEGRFGDAFGGILRGNDTFWVLDAAIGYRLPRRWGLITLEARNLLDRRFRYNDSDPANPTVAPERLILLKFTLAF
jgi:tetratricopeptide (TPR) repeat protein